MIKDFIQYLKDYTYSKEPESLKLIIGTKIKDYILQKVSDSFPIKIYKAFEYFAFISKSEKVTKSTSECCVFSVLFNTNHKDAKTILLEIKKQNLVEKLFMYLYCEYGIVLVNRVNYNENFKIFSKYIVSDVLITGSESYKNVLRCFDLETTNVGKTEHPSLHNWGGKKDKLWEYHKDIVDELNGYNKPSINSFKVKDLRIAVIFDE